MKKLLNKILNNADGWLAIGFTIAIGVVILVLFLNLIYHLFNL